MLNQILLLGPLHMFHFRSGDFETALRYARHGSALANSIEEPAAGSLASCLLGLSLHLIGDLADARAALEAALPYRPGTRWTSTIYLGFEGQMLAGAVLARTLWLQGHPAQAVERARQSVEDAKQTGHPVPVSVALIWASSVLIWTGDLKSAEEHVAWFISHAESHSLGPYLAVGLGLKSELAICRGDAEAGVEGLQASLDRLHGARYELLTTPFTISLIRGLSANGRLIDATALTDETIRQVEANGDLAYLPELLRVKGGLILAGPRPDPVMAEACFRQSLELSRRQGARAWGLRTATDLAAQYFLRDGRVASELLCVISPPFAHNR